MQTVACLTWVTGFGTFDVENLVQVLTPPPPSGLDVKGLQKLLPWSACERFTKWDVTITVNSDSNHISRRPDLQARFDVTFAVDAVVKKNQIWVARLIRFRPLELLE